MLVGAFTHLCFLLHYHPGGCEAGDEAIPLSSGLSLKLFENRWVGDSVARELDTIREFLIALSVTRVIDVLFTEYSFGGYFFGYFSSRAML